MTLTEYIQIHRKTLETTLLTYLRGKQSDFSSKPLYLESIGKIIDTVTGGKLIRGNLVLLGYESKKNSISKDALTLAAAIELFHTGFLIHDDIMDKDHVRRGKPTVFAKAINEGKAILADNPTEYGNAIAICIGDLALFMAYELIAMLENTSQSVRILQTCALELQHVGYAQITDIHFGVDNIEPSEEEILSVYKYKTARYSFSLPLTIGGMLADCDAGTLSKFEQFGEAVGVAFQIRDDELGLFGEEKTIGKPVGSDIRENKKTLIRHKLFNTVDESVRKKLLNIYGNSVFSTKNNSFIKREIQKHNVLSYVQQIRMKQSDFARKILSTIEMRDTYKNVFLDLVNFASDRDK